MKAVMISNKPKDCELIANGKKTVLVRNTIPKINTPFKCLIYCTKIKDEKRYSDEFDIPTNTRKWLGNGKVIGEFVCDKIIEIKPCFEYYRDFYDIDDDTLEETCLNREELHEYGKGISLYAWHISKLKIYDEPKELSEFSMYGFKHLLDSFYYCVITRPPQRWCYCKELEVNEND